MTDAIDERLRKAGKAALDVKGDDSHDYVFEAKAIDRALGYRELVSAARSAEAALTRAVSIFTDPNFTDRYGDGDRFGYALEQLTRALNPTPTERASDGRE